MGVCKDSYKPIAANIRTAFQPEILLNFVRKELINQWNLFLNDSRGIPIELRSVDFLQPSALLEVEVLESNISSSLPPKFRDFLLNDCGGINVWWYFRDNAEVKLIGERESISYGSFEFSTKCILHENPQFSESYNPDDYDSQYRPNNALAFANISNGDQFAVIISGENIDQIIYLNHDLEKLHQYVVGHSIQEFLINFSRLGFVGPEYWIIEQFTNRQSTPIDANSSNAQSFLYCLQDGIRSVEAEAETRRSSEIARLVNYKQIIEPELVKYVQAKSTERFLARVKGYEDLLVGALKARYEYYLNVKSRTSR